MQFLAKCLMDHETIEFFERLMSPTMYEPLIKETSEERIVNYPCVSDLMTSCKSIDETLSGTLNSVILQKTFVDLSEIIFVFVVSQD